MLPIYQVDAFTDQLFGGNPAAVIPLKSWLSDDVMQKIAAENNLSETAFFTQINNTTFELRWFTPAYEIDLCGHATLATAHIIYSELGYNESSITFKTLKAGNLEVTRSNDLYVLNFPSRIPEPFTAPQELISAIGNIQPIEVLKSRDFMFVYENENIVKNLTPDFSAIAKITKKGVIATSKGDNIDFVSRFFIPGAGIDEDPVTGSSHCNLIPYWAEKLQKNKLVALQISERIGKLYCENKNERVLMAGNAITYLKGFIYI